MTTAIVAEMTTPLSAASITRSRLVATNAASQTFFDAECVRVARACHAMAGRFQAGGRLLVHGEAARRSDVSHVVVEFMHPVVVGKRALAALALPFAPTASIAVAAGPLDVLGRAGDILMILADGALREPEETLLACAEAMGMLTIALVGAEVPSGRVPSRFSFSVPSGDACIVQETHEMLYHVLWELVHVFLDHGAVRA